MTNAEQNAEQFGRPQYLNWQGSDGLVVWLTVALILLVWAFHVSSISVGGINHYDEFYTLDRSNSFGVQGDWWTVYTLNEPTFNKPPLQYWMSGWLMNSGADLEVALRLPSMLFALGCLGATALLAAIIVPHNLWVMPASILLCASSDKFWRYATSAMLDTGATFFAILALAAGLLALRNPRYWYVVALAIGLGALQKAPSALALTVVFVLALSLTAHWHEYGFRRIAASRHFRIAATLAVLATLAWPLFQFASYGDEVFDAGYSDQMIDRFSPFEGDGTWRSLSDLYDLLIDDEPVLRGLGMLALIWLPWQLRRPELFSLAAVFLAFGAAMYLAGGSVYPRYSLIVLPLLAVALAAVTVTAPATRWVKVAVIAGVCAAGLGPLKGSDALGLNRSDKRSEQIAVLQAVGEALEQGETLVVCNWIRAVQFSPGAISYYASAGRPVRVLGGPSSLDRRIASGDLSGDLRGLCTSDQLAEIRDRLVNLQVVGESGGYLHWTAEALRP